MCKIKFEFSKASFNKPTPNNVRKFGYALAGAATAGSIICAALDIKLLTIFLALSAYAGAFLKDFFSENIDDSTPQS